MRKLIYLASPHSHPDALVREARYIGVVAAAAKLVERGHMIFAPIAHSHPIHVMMQKFGAPDPDWTFYAEFDTKILGICDELWVLKLEGWETSVGIKAEVKLAQAMGIPVKYIDPETLDVD